MTQPTGLSVKRIARHYTSKKLPFGTGKDKSTDSCPECELLSFDLSTGVCEICGHVGDIEND
jgi:hypothetical protein